MGRMRLSVLLAIVCTLVLFSAVAAANLLPAITVTADGKLPAGWGSFLAAGTLEFSCLADAGMDGPALVTRSEDYARGSLRAKVTVRPEATYKLTLRYRSEVELSPKEDFYSAINVRFLFFDANNQEVFIPWSTLSTDDYSVYLWKPASGIYAFLDYQDDWYTVELKVTVPEDAQEMILDFFQWVGKGAIYWDQVILEEIN